MACQALKQLVEERLGEEITEYLGLLRYEHAADQVDESTGACKMSVKRLDFCVMTPGEIKSTVEKALPGSTVEVRDLTGGGDHFQVLVVSAAFEGKGLLDQQQMVNGALREALNSGRIHALALKTYTPAQWERLGS